MHHLLEKITTVHKIHFPEWKHHWTEVVSQIATKVLMVCRNLAGIMIVYPIIIYSSIAWNSKAEQLTTRNTLALEKVQRLACTCNTGAIGTCPSVALEVTMNLASGYRKGSNRSYTHISYRRNRKWQNVKSERLVNSAHLMFKLS